MTRKSTIYFLGNTSWSSYILPRNREPNRLRQPLLLPEERNAISLKLGRNL